jgi:hypothetical protein
MGPTKAGAGFLATVALTSVVLSMATAVAASRALADDAEAKALKQVQREVRLLRADRERDRKLIERLEQKLDQVQLQDSQIRTNDQQLQTTTDQLQNSNRQLQTKTDEELKQVQAQVVAGPSERQLAQALSGYWGTHQFTIAGGAAASFIYDRQLGQNTFAVNFNPEMFFRVNDWILFQGSLDAGWNPGGSGASFSSGVADAQIFLNDYIEVVAGAFDQPFDDFYEDLSAFWVNRFITAPLPFGVRALVPPSDIGIQLRGGYQWGGLGQDVDYTVWAANGPSFDSALPQPVIGQALNGFNNIGSNTNGRAYNGRFRVYPFPLDSNLGRLELGASTYNGKWLNGLWFNSWGIDFAYLRGNLQGRGSFLETYRQMPTGTPSGHDNRQGWYIQAGYFLNGLHIPGWREFDPLLAKLEPLVRYSGVNQRAVVADEIPTTTSLGFSGSPSAFAPHAREVALGLDYWIAPSIALQTEFDIELPQNGGSVVNFAGPAGVAPVYSPFGTAHNDRAVLTQFTAGF